VSPGTEEVTGPECLSSRKGYVTTSLVTLSETQCTGCSLIDLSASAPWYLAVRDLVDASAPSVQV
jgi:hypothetical protein